ncbi:NUDIX domain-containing protein [Neolewinella lacunae]|uniref:NUDIX domain-containing protein n=1 Tax=Neolewinella lacunae TaxID=1517758 RepID=A0A923TA45_9BACT|nr:NUDIX domain-containing protein [Neolewinella lacunae]MBC6996176.1 NUDIX domain-containing protein [Neolewinella lacunae]MDN3634027.1 NUDIX domain-containing protein [Neolewinella lacunae]
MYEIYVNDRPLTLLSQAEHRTCGSALHVPDPATHLLAQYSGKPRTILQYVDMLEKASPKVTSVALVAPDVEQLWQDLQTHFRWVPAAGGLVRQAQTDQHLFIFRRGSWDLPKGKIDPGETPPQAAIREVSEETGLQQLELGEALPTTYHTYRNGKEKRILKPTYWFRMTSAGTALTPQAEEDIERAEWRSIGEVLADPGQLYASLRRLLEQVNG